MFRSLSFYRRLRRAITPYFGFSTACLGVEIQYFGFQYAMPYLEQKGIRPYILQHAFRRP